MKDKIVGILKDSDKALTIYDLEDKLHLLDVDELQELQTCLSELEKDAVIYHSNKDKYMMLEDSHLKRGIMRANKKGFGFVDIDDSDVDVYISEEHMNGALHDDIVLVEITSKKGIDRLEGRVVKIINREKDTYVGEINFEGDTGIVSLDDNKLKIKVQIPRDKSMNAVDGHKVVVRLGKRIDNSRFMGEVVEIIGHKNDPGIDILSIVKKYNIETDFPDDVKEQLKNIPSEVSEEECKNRRDLRNEMIFTIDGDDTKDIDDAISLEILPNGNYQLGVHITDVTYYIKEGSELDRLALKKGTSYYLADTVIPMYPKLFSNGIGSLNPNVERLALSCVMEINRQGNVVNYNIFESVIKSKIQMTYKKVNDILDNNIVAAGYENFVSTLKDMYKLSLILNKKRILHGALEFGMPQQKIKLDEKGFPLDFEILSQGTGENLIEEFMLVANQTVAQALGEYDYPTMYRVHDVPAPEVVNYFIELINKLGIKYQRREQLDLQHEMQYLSSFVNSYGSKSGPFQYAFLRVLRKAYYSTDNIGHFGLAYKDYVHFTSPIRRYPDDTVHRSIRKYLLNKDKNFDLEEVAKDYEILEEKAHLCSINEKKSDKCELIINAMKAAEYMERHIGEHFIARVLSVDNKGLSIQLQNLIDGRIKINDLDVPYRFDQDSMSLQSLASDECFCYGDLIDVYVVDASKKDKTISFKVSSIIEKNTLARKSFKSKSDKSCYNKVYRKEKK